MRVPPARVCVGSDHGGVWEVIAVSRAAAGKTVGDMVGLQRIDVKIVRGRSPAARVVVPWCEREREAK